MTQRKSFKIQRRVAHRFETYMKPHETQTQALDRLMDEAGVAEHLECADCGDEIVPDRYGYYTDSDGEHYHIDCMPSVNTEMPPQ